MRSIVTLRKTSRVVINGLPLYDIAPGPLPECGQDVGSAEGVFAFGDVASGIFACGTVVKGVVAEG